MATDPSWAGTLTVSPGQICYVGALSDAHPHHHVATQLIRVWSGTVELTDAHGHRAVAPAAVIPSGRAHGIRIVEPASGILMFIDPGSPAGAWFDTVAAGDAASWVCAGRLLQHWTPTADPAGLVQSIPGIDPAAGTDRWHPAVRAAVALIPELLPGPVRLSDVAARVALSPGRLGRLFNDQVGLSIPAYVRWSRLRCAMDALRAGASLTDAAHAAGFTDSAHANRVCHEMFGLSPSAASGQLHWA